MSIVKFCNGKNRGTDALKQGLEYILNPAKTTKMYVLGNGVDTDVAWADMYTIQRLLHQDTGRRYIHYILSFDSGVTNEKAYKTAKECAEYFADCYQYILALHTNTDNVHAHVILNAVNIRTGKKFTQSKKELFAFRDYVNECLLRNGLNPINSHTSKKLVCEEVCDVTEFELDYERKQNLCIPHNNTFSEVIHLDAYNPVFSFFGSVNPEEAIVIQEAERADRKRRQIVRYFEGEESTLPSDVTLLDAEEYYFQWLEGQKILEQEEVNHGYFAKHTRRTDC